MTVKSYLGRGAAMHVEIPVFRARRSVYVSSPWISPYYARKLVELASSGVRVRVITSDEGREQKESLKIFRDALRPRRRLLGLIRDKSWVPPDLEVLVTKGWKIHAKMYVVDMRYAVVGSANLTESGMQGNLEHIVVLEGQEGRMIGVDFEALWDFIQRDESFVVEKIGPPED